MLGLAFVQDPAFTGGWSGPCDDQGTLHVRLELLVRERAEANPANWNTAGAGRWHPGEVPGVAIEDTEIDLGKAVRSVGDPRGRGSAGSTSSGSLRSSRSRSKPFGVDPAEIAAGVNGMHSEGGFGLDIDAILGRTPASSSPCSSSWACGSPTFKRPG